MVDYTLVSEITGYNVAREQVQRMYTRYRFAGEFCKDKEVLEIACGSGQGLGYLAKVSKRVVGGDFDDKMVELAGLYYGTRLEVRKMDAHQLPFDDRSLDVVILYEAIYYLHSPAKFINEAYRVLRQDGVLIVCSANKDGEGFNPSPYSIRYFSAPELHGLLAGAGFPDVSLYGNCRVREDTMRDKIISLIKKIAVSCHLIPRTMKGKEIFKRVFMGKLTPLPPEIKDGMADYDPPLAIRSDMINSEYKVLFAVASKRNGTQGAETGEKQVCTDRS